MSTIRYDDLILCGPYSDPSEQYSAEQLQTAVLVPRPEMDPRMTAPREQSALMLANPSSLALSLVAIATYTAVRLVKKATKPQAEGWRTDANRRKESRRTAA